MSYSHQHDISKRINEAVDKWRRLELELSRRGNETVPGDLFLFPIETNPILQWAIIQSHPDEKSLLFAVPADINLFVGSADVAVNEESRSGPLSLRCGHGLWVRLDDFRFARRSGILDAKDVVQVRDKLAQLARGSTQATSEQEETDFDPDYEDWVDQVSDARDILSEWLSARPAASSDLCVSTRSPTSSSCHQEPRVQLNRPSRQSRFVAEIAARIRDAEVQQPALAALAESDTAPQFSSNPYRIIGDDSVQVAMNVMRLSPTKYELILRLESPRIEDSLRYPRGRLLLPSGKELPFEIRWSTATLELSAGSWEELKREEWCHVILVDDLGQSRELDTNS